MATRTRWGARLNAARKEAERLGYTCTTAAQAHGGATLTMRKDVAGWRGGPVTGFAEATLLVGDARAVLSSCTLAHGCPGDVARIIYMASDDAMTCRHCGGDVDGCAPATPSCAAARMAVRP